MGFCDTGQGAVATFSGGAFSVNIKNVNLGQETRADIVKTHLGSTRKEYAPGDIPDDGEITIPFQWDASANSLVTGEKQTVTVTFNNGLDLGLPLQTTFTAFGYINSVTRPNLQTDSINEGEIKFRINGETVPSFDNV